RHSGGVRGDTPPARARVGGTQRGGSGGGRVVRGGGALRGGRRQDPRAPHRESGPQPRVPRARRRAHALGASRRRPERPVSSAGAPGRLISPTRRNPTGTEAAVA